MQILLIIVVAALTSLVVALTFAFISLVGKYTKAKNENVELVAGKAKVASKQIMEAEAEARGIIDAATKEAGEIIKRANKLDGEYKSSLKKALEEADKNLAEEFKSTLQEAKSESVRALEDVTGVIKTMSTSTSEEFSKTISVVISSFETSLAGQLENSRAQMLDALKMDKAGIEKELEEYKNVRLQKLQEGLLEVAKDALKEVVGVSLSASDHRQLVLNALEEAKKKNIL